METDSNKQEKFRKFIKSPKEDKNSFYTKEEVDQLKTYNILLFDYFIWNYLDSHLQLFRSFLDSEITSDTFADQFLSLRSTHIADFRKWMKELEFMSLIEIAFGFLNQFNFDLNPVVFPNIIDLVEQYCDLFVSDEQLLEIGGSREKVEIDEN